MSGALVAMSHDDCVALLATHDTGRICVMHDNYPMAFPVNYRLVDLQGAPAIAIRTRTGNSLDHVDEAVGFEIDGVGPGHDGGWSVIVRGHLRRVGAGAEVDSYPLITEQRDAWRLIVPVGITGRAVRADPDRWSFNPAGYL